jgi:xylulokinase
LIPAKNNKNRMPALSSKNAASLFLGLELATDQLRASIVDESLDLVGVESVDFDSELPEFQYVSNSYLIHY